MSTNMNAISVVSLKTPSSDSVSKTSPRLRTEAVESSLTTQKTDVSVTTKKVQVPLQVGVVETKDDKSEIAGIAHTLNDTEVSEAVKELNDYVQNTQRHLNFSIDDATGHTLIKVIDSNTKETIRQIPSEDIVALAERMRKNANSKGNIIEIEA